MSTDTIAIIATAIASWALVIVTIRYMGAQVRAMEKDLLVRMLLVYEDRFSGKIRTERRYLANQIRLNTRIEEISERVPEFFESLGLMVKKQALDKEMVFSSFSFYIVRWYVIMKPHIFEWQKLYSDTDEPDTGYYSDFKDLAIEMYKMDLKERGVLFTDGADIDIKLSDKDIARFIDDEYSSV